MFQCLSGGEWKQEDRYFNELEGYLVQDIAAVTPFRNIVVHQMSG